MRKLNIRVVVSSSVIVLKSNISLLLISIQYYDSFITLNWASVSFVSKFIVNISEILNSGLSGKLNQSVWFTLLFEIITFYSKKLSVTEKSEQLVSKHNLCKLYVLVKFNSKTISMPWNLTHELLKFNTS